MILDSDLCSYLYNLRIRDNHEELVTEPDGVEGTKFLVPMIQGDLRIVSQEWERPLTL